mmetsp:Transcript_3533/g.12403  ORF Transcript_3533/g.12403 Transcript_3533/m.12403 type:complete len:124 (+) Transcript_3533:2354-2725(+)
MLRSTATRLCESVASSGSSPSRCDDCEHGGASDVRQTGPVSKKVDPAAKFVFDLILEEVDASAPSHLRLILAVGRAGGQARRARHHFARHADLKPSEGGKSPLLARSLSSARVDDDLLEAQAY